MIKVPKEVLIQKIKENTKLTDKEIERKVKDKLDQLSGLISETGALHIIANELGVKVVEETSGKLQVKNIMAGMRSVDLVAKVTNVYEVREFNSNDRKGKVGNFMAGDETGSIRVVAWNDKADMLAKLNPGTVIKIEGGYTRDNRGRAEIHIGERSTLVISPKGEKVDVKEAQRERKRITDLSGNEENVEIMGTIVQVFDPRFFEICPECNKRAKETEGEYKCEEHGTVEPTYSYVSNIFLDDGTENVRVVLWKNQSQRLFSMTDEEIISKREEGFEEVKNELLGKIMKFVGRTSKNEMFDRIEFVPNLVITDPDPSEEIANVKEEIEKKESKAEKDKSEEIVEEITDDDTESSTDDLDIDDSDDLDVDADSDIDKNIDNDAEELDQKKKDSAGLDVSDIDDLGDLDDLNELDI